MNADWSEAIVSVPTERLQEWADHCIAAENPRVLSGPERALMVVRATESRDRSSFVLGEVLVTRCEVELGQSRGWGVVVGDDPVRALSVAILDAAGEQGRSGLHDALATELETIREARSRRWSELQRTRATFEDLA